LAFIRSEFPPNGATLYPAAPAFASPGFAGSGRILGKIIKAALANQFALGIIRLRLDQ